MWILIAGTWLAVTGYKTEADCLAAARELSVPYMKCIPAPADAQVIRPRR